MVHVSVHVVPVRSALSHGDHGICSYKSPLLLLLTRFCFSSSKAPVVEEEVEEVEEEDEEPGKDEN